MNNHAEKQVVPYICGRWKGMKEHCLTLDREVAYNDFVTVAVVVPAHNASQTIVSTIDSILKSISDGDRIFVIENGSMDDTWQKLCATYQENSAVCLTQSDIANASIARNLGVELAHEYDYVAFCDADDTWHPRKLEWVRKIIASNSPDVIFHPMLSVGDKRITLEGAGFLNKRLPRTPKLAWDLAVYGNFFPTSAMVLRRCVLPNPVFLPELKQTQDYEAWCAIAHFNANLNVAYIDLILGIHSWMGGLSNAVPARMRNIWWVSAHYLENAPLKLRAIAKFRMLAHIVWWLGKTKNLGMLRALFLSSVKGRQLNKLLDATVTH
jgi:glycosyltransferase involved in cell wall biosynthesis